MDPGLAAILGAVAGAFAGLLSSIGVEWYGGRCSRGAVASMLAAEIDSILDMAKRRNHAAWYEDVLPRLEAGEDIVMPDLLFKHERKELEPVIDRYLGEVGLLPGSLPGRVAQFYSQLRAVRASMDMLAAGLCDGDPQWKAHVIRSELAPWQETVVLGRKLAEDLRKQRLGWLLADLLRRARALVQRYWGGKSAPGIARERET